MLTKSVRGGVEQIAPAELLQVEAELGTHEEEAAAAAVSAVVDQEGGWVGLTMLEHQNAEAVVKWWQHASWVYAET